MDNLAIKGLDDESPARRGKKRRGRKLFAIEGRMVYAEGVARFKLLDLGHWWVHGRYETAAPISKFSDNATGSRPVGARSTS